MFGKKRKPQDFQAELDAHLAFEADELRAEGLSAEEARFAARRAFGNRTAAEERFYESGRGLAQHLLRDLRFAVRIFGKDPKFSLLTVLGLALGIGVSTALFSLVGFMVNNTGGTGFRPPDPVRNPETYVSINGGEAFFQLDFSDSEFRYLRDHSKSVEQMTAESGPSSFVLGTPSGGSAAEEVSARFESSNFLAMRGFRAQIGRVFSEDEDRAGAPFAVLSYAIWQRRFGGDKTVIGQTVLLNNHVVTITGVADARFHSADNADLFLPLGLKPLLPANVQLMVNARLPSGTSLPQAQGEIESLTKSFDDANPPAPTRERADPRGARRAEVFIGTVAPSTRLEQREDTTASDLAISMILMIACSNLASLLLARATARRREFGVRLSLGASRARLVSQLLTESLLLAITGGLVGILVSTWLARWLAVSIAGVPGAAPPIDHGVLLYGLLLSLVTGVSFGLGPALAVTKTDLAKALHSEGMAGNPTSVFRLGWSRRNLLVVVPLALSLMLLIGAAILIQTVRTFGFINTSFDSTRVIALAFRLNDQGYSDARAAQFRQELRDRISVLPGVASAAITDDSPFVPGSCQLRNPPPVAGSYAACHRVSAEFFEALNLRILRGRAFTAADGAGSAPVAIVSRSFANKFLAGRQPLGERLQTTGGSFEIVGLTDDLCTAGPIPWFPAVYIPAAQEAGSVSTTGRWVDRMELLVRTKGDPASLSAELRQAVRAADPSLWVSIQTIDRYLERFSGNGRLAIYILAGLGALVLLMASAGIYALLAYSVSQRTREIGIRMALGARNREILMLVMRRTLILIAWGIACGLLGALALGQILAAMVFKTPPPDAPTSIGVALALAATSLLASYLPARKALRVNPVETLRCD